MRAAHATFALALVAAGASAFHGQTPEAEAETARWLLHKAEWGYFTFGSHETLRTDVLSLADGDVGADDPAAQSTGRIFVYLMKGEVPEGEVQSALTISEAEYNATCGFAGRLVDPEDPRCAKLTLSGSLSKCKGADEKLGKAALFSRHPQMEGWPVSHGFTVYELILSDIWMIDFYGGGSNIDVDLFHKVKPEHNVPSFPPAAATAAAVATPSHASPPPLAWHAREPEHEHEHRIAARASAAFTAPPPHDHVAARARWLVYNSMWGVVSTTSVRLNGHPWGNVRAVADGVGANSSGLPVLYLPTPDPTAVDIVAENHCVLSLSEAALPERLLDAHVCGNKDPEDPTCARISIRGSLRELTQPDELAQAMVSMSHRHPKAPWLSKGGAHTGGKYYQIKPTGITFLDFYGGPADLSVEEYLANPHTHPQ